MIALRGWFTLGVPRGGIDDAMEGGKTLARERRGRCTARRAKEEEIERIRADPAERFFSSLPLFFSCRVITSLSARQLRRKKSNNNHIYGAAASLRCIDPRRWPGEGGKERKERTRRSSEAEREREDRGGIGQKECQRFVGIEVLCGTLKPGFFRPKARAVRQNRMYNYLP